MKTLDEIKQMMAADETFKRIHDELAPEMERLEKKEPKAGAARRAAFANLNKSES